MFASIPSVWAAYKAPFPLDGDDHKSPVETGSAGIAITPDDPTRLCTAEQQVQRIAGKASSYAMINVLVLLIADAKLLGWLQGATRDNVVIDFVIHLPFVNSPHVHFNTGLSIGQIVFILLSVFAALKLFLSVRTFKVAEQTAAESANCPDNAYLGNAQGAKIATIICALISISILVFGYKQAF